MGALTQSPAWQQLLRHAEGIEKTTLADIVFGDAGRISGCDIKLDGLRFNYALNHATPETIGLLVKLAVQQKLPEWRDRMFAGEKINTTENRAVLHTALRAKNGPVLIDGKDVFPEIAAVRQRMTRFAEEVRSGKRKGATGKSFRHVVNIGIGGSDLGPRLAARALTPYINGPKPHFVANVDAFDLLSVLKDLDPAETLFLVVSKTFTTQETLLNARSARQWLVAALGEKAVSDHFVAVSVNEAEVRKFGIDTGNMFPMWDWVGGRYSLWSAIGLSVALAIGAENFQKLLDGAATVDAHFKTAPLDKNIPVLMALLGVWHRNFRHAGALAVLPYCERLRDLPRFLQQLDMESNGKSVTRDGASIDYSTSPVIFGDCGTVGQHSFHQWLHQGSDIVPADFIGVAEDAVGRPEHHAALLSNMLAQMAALACGRPQASMPYEVYAGGRSSNLLLLDRLDPACLGMLLALYEHKIFTQGVLWNVNSFDQPGVELGKKLAHDLEAHKPSQNPAGHLTVKLSENLLPFLWK
jgi:glucose-6-phosphate isomerase